MMISFCCKYEVMSSRRVTVAVADDVCEELLKHVMLTVPHSPEQSFIGVLGKSLSSAISRVTEAEPDPSADESFDALFV